MTDDYEKEKDAMAEAEGQPDLSDARPDEEVVLPGESAGASRDYGTTSAEQRAGEPLGDRLAREASGEEPVDGNALSGRLVDPESNIGELDETPELVAMEEEEDSGPLSPEEQAMHIEEET